MIADLTSYADTLNQACNSHSVEEVLRFYSNDYIGSDIAETTLLMGRQGMRSLLERYWRAFPDLHFQVTERLIQGAHLTVVWLAEGTHRGPILNIPATGRQVKVKGISLLEVQAGLVIRGQNVWDLAGMLRHLGLLPDLSSTEA
jgi:steroid delta-isomerase-like uncharacterized protein